MNKIEIRNFTKDDFKKLGELYHAVTSRNNAVFWWVGEEENWSNVFIAVQGDQLLGKGQVSVISSIAEGSPKDYRHNIYFNLKVLPEKEEEFLVYDVLYERLVDRACQLKEKLPHEYRTMIAVGNQSTEEQNNNYFLSKGFEYWKSLFTMQRNLSELVDQTVLSNFFSCHQSDMTSEESVNEYLSVEMEIWPEAPIGKTRLMDLKKNSSWTTFVVRDQGTFVGSVMAWIDEDGDGVIEDLFVRKPWRKQGIANHLLTQALLYLKNHECKFVELQVETANASALSLYKSVGFIEVAEEVRYCKEL